MNRQSLPLLAHARTCFALALLALVSAAGEACAQATGAAAYPARPVRLVVPFPAGGSADAAARIIGDKLGEEWKQPVVIENRPGAGTTIAAAFVAAAPPDGYTLYLTGLITHASSAALYRNLSYDALKSFAPVGMVSAATFILIVHPALPAKTLRDLVALARARPGALTYASTGTGAAPHLATVMFAHATGIELVHVPFKGTAPALVALMGGQVDFLIADVSALPQIQSGKVRALAVTTAQRSALVPGVPTFAEAGVPGVEVPSNTGILAPAGTPADIVAKINAGINRALALDDVRRRLAAQGFEPAPGSSEAFGAFLAREVEKYRRIVSVAGISVD